MTSGVIVFVDPDAGAPELSANLTAADSLLPVSDAGAFDEDFDEPRFLAIGDDLIPREYVAVANDDEAPQSVTLADPVGTDYEAGLPVYLWDPDAEGTDKRAVQYEAQVRLEGDVGTIPATVRHTLVPLAGTDLLNGASVTLEQGDDDEWYVATVDGRIPTIDGSFVSPGTVTANRFQTNDSGARIVIDDTGGPYVTLLTGDSAEGFTDGGRINGSVSGSGGSRRGLLELRAPDLSGTVTPSGYGKISLYGESPDFTAPTAIAVSAATAEFTGTMQINSLADGGTNNTGSGAKYCRVGGDGVLFSSTSSPSSRTVKHDIADLDLDILDILALRPVTFRYNDDPDTVRVGFIAEEAHDLGLTALVGYEDREDASNPTGFDYDGMGAALLLVAQRQQERLDNQRDRIKALEDRLDALER